MFLLLLVFGIFCHGQTIETINNIVRGDTTNQYINGASNIQFINGTTISTTSTVSVNSIVISGATTLESGVTCSGALPSAACYGNFSSLSCSSPVPSSCIPATATFNTVFVTGTLYTNSSINYQLVNQTSLTVTNLTSNGTTAFLGAVSCIGAGSFPPSCFNLSMTCSSSVSTNCLAMAQSFTNINVSGVLAVNTVTCPSGTIDSSCFPMRIERINGVSPVAAAFTFTAGTNVTLTPITNGLSVSTTNTVRTQYQGTTVVAASNTLNFLGNAVSTNATTIYIPGTILIATQDEGVSVGTVVDTLNFQGDGVNVTSTGTNSVNVTIPNPNKLYYEAFYSANTTTGAANASISMTNLTLDDGYLQFAPNWNGNTFSVSYPCLYNIGISYLSTTGTVRISANQTNTTFASGNLYNGQSVAANVIGLLSVAQYMYPGEQWTFYNSGSGSWTPNTTYPEYSFMSVRCVFI